MTTIINSNFKSHIINQLIESITEPANNVYYAMVGNQSPPATGDSTVPEPYDRVLETFIEPYQKGIFGKKIVASDVSLMIKRYDWVANTSYSMYDDSNTNLFKEKFYVVTNDNTNYFVYKVLNNNGNTASIQKPTDVTESACNFVTTSDGYVWKFMYKMYKADFEKFATTEYMPVVTSANVSGNSIPGAIDVVKVDFPGSNYVATLTGTFNTDDLRGNIPTVSGDNTTYRLTKNASANNNFYTQSAIYITAGTGAGQLRKIVGYSGGNTKVAYIDREFLSPPDASSEYIVTPYITITGDGSNATGYAVVSSNTSVNNFVTSVKIIDRGFSYTQANVVITGNTGGITNTALLRAIIPPKGGHGANPYQELSATELGIGFSFSNNENGFISTKNDYRTLYILKDPLFNGVNLTLNNYHGSFTGNEKVYQVNNKLLYGNVSVNTSCTIVYGTSTDFQNSLVQGDYIVIEDVARSLKCLRSVVGVDSSNDTIQQVTLNKTPSFSVASGKIYAANLISSGYRSGNTLPYLSLSNVEPKFETGKFIIGESSDAYGTITDINVNEKNYNNWNTFDNRFRMQYSLLQGNSVVEDSVLYQGAPIYGTGIYHSSNSTYLFMTSVTGVFNTDPIDPVLVEGSSSSFTVGGDKYYSDIAKGSGEVIYKENFFPITRSNSQTEAFKIILSF